MGDRTPGRHLDDARLHAYAAGEVDPSMRTVIDAHLDGCDRCRDALGRIGAVVGLIDRMSAEQPDDLRWRRMQDRVRQRLEADAASDGLTTLDLFMGRRWVTAGTAAVAAVALLVWFAPPRSSPRTKSAPIQITKTDQRDPQVVATDGAPVEIRLAGGAELTLAKQSRIVASPAGDVDVELEIGELAVRLPETPNVRDPFKVRTPAFTTYARSRDYTVGFRADHYLLAVRDGEVDIEGDAFEGRETVVEGEKREVRLKPSVRKKPPKVTKAEVLPKPTLPPVVETPTVDDVVVTKSSEGETSVQVLAPDDPTTAAWRRASRAYYKEGDLEAAIQHAQIVAAGAPDRGEVRLARRMICDARIALVQPQEAITACRLLLDGERRIEELRTVHFMLGTIYRTQLGDCRSANVEYEAVLAFGRTALLDDEARLFRAGCALDLGDFVTAQNDIRSLTPHAARLSRPAELRALERRLSAILSAQEDPNAAEEK